MVIGVVAIVKDEAANIDRLLGSVDGVVDAAVFVDTGSSDDTMHMLRRAGCAVHERPWVDFGHNRSEAFALARGTADWLLALDADMTVEIDSDFEPDPAVDAYLVRMGDNPDFAYRLPLLLRGDLPWESRGVVHEYTCLPDREYIGVPTDKVRVTLHGNRSSPDRSRWHASLLEADLAAHPDNARSVFYLANTYWDLHDPRALAMYECRTRMGGYDEEVFYSLYRYALSLPTWPARFLGLLRAWEYRPTRLEPLAAICRELNATSQHQTAYRFASVPIVPTTDNLFVHAGVWRYGMDFERSIAAWWTGRRDESREIGESLLTREIPQHIREQVERNLAFCKVTPPP